MGDALAVALLVERGFRAEDFAIFHPGGALGKKLLLRVEDLMHGGDSIPLVQEEMLMKEALFVITSKGLGITGVTDAQGKLTGVITDGDLRRCLERGEDILHSTAGSLMHRNPKRILCRELAAAALQLMERHSITTLFAFEDEQSQAPCGVIHLHDILKAGIA